MCGFGVELRRTAGRPRRARADGRRRWRRAAPTAPGSGSTRASGWSTGGWRSSTSPSAARSRCATALGLTIVFNGCIYNHHELRARAARARARVRARSSDTEVLLKGWAQWGEDLPSHLHGMFAFALHERRGRARSSSATGSASSRCIWPRPAARCAPRRRCRRCCAGGGVDTRVDPVALHHYLCVALGRPRAADDPARRRASCRRPRCWCIEPDGRRREHVYWDPPFERRLRRRRLAGARCARRCRSRGPAADGGRRAGRDPALAAGWTRA